MVEYHLPVAPGGVADIFSQLESNKNALQIKHFSVSQTTLDEVRGKKATRHDTHTQKGTEKKEREGARSVVGAASGGGGK